MFGMKTKTGWILGALALAGVALTPQAAQAVLIGGVEFPQGAISFADEVTSYSVGGGGVAGGNQNSSLAVGAPNGAFVSLGDGGSIILRFTNNLLTGSGNSDLDLWIFEVGPDVEADETHPFILLRQQRRPSRHRRCDVEPSSP